MINIYVGSYVDEMDGVWIELPCDEQELWETIYENCAVGAEEFGIFDYECDLGDLGIGEFSDINDVNRMADIIEGYDDDELEIVVALLAEGYDFEEADNLKSDCTYYDTDDMSEIAKEIYAPIVDEFSDLYDYIDWDMLGDDMRVEMNIIESPNGLVQVRG